MQATRREILAQLRALGSATSDELAARVGLAPVTLRRHLALLRERGLVTAEARPDGRGRPPLTYRLTVGGGEILAEDRYEVLALRLLDAVKAEDALPLEGFFRSVASQVAAEHRAAFEDRPLAERIEAAVDLLTAEGFAVRLDRDGEDWRLHAVGCPYQSVGALHHEVCAMDLALLEGVAGVAVERERWRVEGDEECVFRLRAPGEVPAP
jgi:predicted ArsR family transcriptional regulator